MGYYLKIFVIAFFATLFAGCTKDNLGDGDYSALDQTKDYVDMLMSEIYYWNTQTPVLDAELYDDIFEYFDDKLVPQDKWSWMTTQEEYNQLETGDYVSYGVELAQPIEYYNDYTVYVRTVYPNSPFYNAGVRRGWALTHINGIEVMSLIRASSFESEFNKNDNNFTFLLPDKTTATIHIAKASFNVRSVLDYRIYPSDQINGSAPIGYMNYISFNSGMLDDLYKAFADFKDAGIKSLILDLRYNGGGDVKASEELASLLAPSSADGEILLKRIHNQKYREWDSEPECISKIKRQQNSLDLTELYIITGKGTASASEVLINGLKPYMDIKQVGDTTYGKPNGMYAMTESDYVFLPIAFYTVNKNGEGFYDNGIVPTFYVADDLYNDFGANEAAIKACLNYHKTGEFSQAPQLKSVSSSSGVRLVTKEDKPNYGFFKGEILNNLIK